MKRKLGKYAIVIIFCLVSLVTPTHASDYLYIKIADTDWMMPATNTIYNEKGMYLWFGTDKGIFRFDGDNIKNYAQDKKDNPLHSSVTFNFSKDEAGNLWALTNQGIGIYNRHTDEFQEVRCEDSNVGPVGSCCLLKNGVIFSGIGKLFMYDYERKDLQVLARLPRYQNIFIGSMYRLSEEEVVLTLHHEVAIYNLTTQKITLLPIQSTVSSLFVDNQLRIWVGCYNKGLVCFDKTGVKLAEYSDKDSGFYKETVISMVQCDSLLWTGIEGGGIRILNPKSHHTRVIKHVPGEKHSFPSNSISCLYKDSNDIIWAGSVRDGIISIRKGGMNFYSEAEGDVKYGLSNSAVLSIYQTPCSQDVWIGTDGEGINKLNLITREFTHYDATRNMKVVSIARYSDHELLLSIYLKGLYIFNTLTGKIQLFMPNNEKETQKITQSVTVINLVNETEKSLLILTDRIYRWWLDSNKIELVNFNFAYRGSIILGAGAFEEQLFFYNNRNIYSLNQKAPDMQKVIGLDKTIAINSAAVDYKGNIWIATNKGILYYSLTEKKLHKVPTNLLKNTSIIFPDNKGRVWIGEGDKLYAYQQASNRFAIFGESDGARPNQYIKKARLLTSKGEILLGGTRGLLVIDDSFKVEDSEDPAIILTGLQIDKRPIHLSKPGTATNIEVPSGSKLIEMQVATIEKDILRPKIYRFKVTGANEQFYESYTPLFAMNSLLPGKSSVYVSCSTRRGEWTPYACVLSIDYPPVWYKSLWFFLLCILLLLSLPVVIVSAVYRRKRNILRLQLKEREKDIYQEKVNFLININHELRTPLTLINGPLKLMIQRMVPESENYVPLQKIYRQSLRMKNLLNMVLDLRKMEVGEKSLKVSSCVVNDWIRQIVSDFCIEEGNSIIRIQLDLSPDVECVNLDMEKCEIILTNLLINAIKHSQPDDVIWVKTMLTDDHKLKISVKDQGKGFHDIDPTKLFSRFYQGADEKNGTGIGLSYSKVLVELHNGEIGATANVDKGATFFFTIPLNLNTGEQKCEPKAYLNELFSNETSVERSGQEKLVPVDYDVSHYTLLLVDDSKELTDFLKDSLEKEFKKILVAANGVQAWEIIQKHTPDIIVSDVMMPKMNGYELCHRIKRDIKFSHLPVILLTAKNEVRNEEQGYKMGADAFLSKPFDTDTLCDIIKNNLRLRNHIKQQYMQLSVLPEPKTDTFSQVDESFLIKMNKIITENINNSDLDVPFLCKEMGMSKTSLYMKLKAITGIGCNEYITKLRLERAMVLIKTTDKSFVDIAFETGFANSKYFSTSFKQYTGLTPTQYKKDNK